MTVGKAIAKAEKNKRKEISVMVDARDILDALELIDECESIPCEDKIKLAIHEIKGMNITIPYNLTLINDMGNIETLRPIED